MIFEGIITTRGSTGAPHVTPLGFERDGDLVVLRPFVPSTTLDNLRRARAAVISLSDEVLVMAGALTGRRDWPLVAVERVVGWRLEPCLASIELEVEREQADAERPAFFCRVRHEATHGRYPGANRARAAIIEACILVSRLDFIDAAKLEGEMTYLHIAVSKTAGADELKAWGWLLDAIEAHPRTFFDGGHLRL